MKLYTKTGDSGETGLADATRTRKESLTIDVIGEVDELNSFVGLAKCHCKDENETKLLEAVQSNLFTIGAVLAKSRNVEFTREKVEQLEKTINEIGDSLPQLKNFVLPGGCAYAAKLHVCRSVSRRVERRVLQLNESEPVDQNIRIYLNRLSSLFFGLALKANAEAGIKEALWLLG